MVRVHVGVQEEKLGISIKVEHVSDKDETEEHYLDSQHGNR